MRRFVVALTLVSSMAALTPSVVAEYAPLESANISARVSKGFESIDRLTIRKDEPRSTFWNDGPFTVGPDSRRDDATSRSFWSFDIARLRDKQVLSAELMTVEASSGSCQERPVQVWRTSRITPRSTWRDQPEWKGRLDTRSSAQGFSSDCPMGPLHFDVTRGVKFVVNHHRSRVHLGLRAGDESDPRSWKRFQASAYLSVEYLTPPTPPADMRFVEPAAACGASDSPSAIAAETPRLSMLLKNPDAGDADLDVEVEIWEVDEAAEPITEPVWTFISDLGYAGDSTAQVGIPEGVLTDGSTYRVRARTYYWFGVDNYALSAWTSGCWFEVDTTPPPEPTVGSDFPECTDDACPVGPRSGVFYFSSFSPDVVLYRHSLDGVIDHTSRENPGELAQLEVSVDAGPHVMQVWSVDRAGNLSPSVTYQFFAG